MLKKILLHLYYCLWIVISFGCFENNKVDFKTQMLIEINKQRLGGCFCGQDSMPPVDELIYSEILESAAERHVTDMTDNDFFDHIGTDGSTPQKRAIDAGFTGAYIGENIARGYIEVDDVMLSWLSSNEHCRTIMSPYFSCVGVAQKDYYWVQVFGSD